MEICGPRDCEASYASRQIRGTSHLHFVSYIIPPQTFAKSDPAFLEQVFQLPTREIPPTAEHPLRIFAAQFDLTDPSRFTIPYEYLGFPGHFTGQITNTPYPQLTLTHADGPLLLRYPFTHL